MLQIFFFFSFIVLHTFLISDVRPPTATATVCISSTRPTHNWKAPKLTAQPRLHLHVSVL